MKARLTLTLDQVLSMVPAFRQKLMQKWGVVEKLKQQETSQANLLKAEVADVDYKVPILDVKYAGFEIKGNLLDGSS